ncbi:RNA 2'-phosphotransferase [Streptomyces violarus]
MDERRTVKVSKYLSKHLRHQPARIGLALDEAGWVEIDTLIAAAAAHGFPFTRAELDHVVATNDKRRFAVEGTRIRASQGHSVEVDLGLPTETPPAYLYHGTVARNLDAIRAEGLRPMNRHAVRLSPRPGDGDPRRRPPWPACRADRGRGRHASRRPCLPGERERRVADPGCTGAVSAPSRASLTCCAGRAAHGDCFT